MSGRKKTLDLPARLADPKRSAEVQSVVKNLLGLEPLYPPPPDTMSPLEKIKLYAREGFLHRADGKPEDFERLWVSAVHEVEEKGVKE